MVTRQEEEKRLLKRSKDFLETAEYQIGKGFYDLAAFSLEQALQLFLKAKVLAEGVTILELIVLGLYWKYFQSLFQWIKSLV